MYFSNILAFLYLVVLKRVQIRGGYKFYGLPKVLKHKGSSIKIGKRFESRNFWYANPLGINHPTILCTWAKGSKIIVGDDVGISGGSIVASVKIEIGSRTLIGANSTIIDTDFHPAKAEGRRYSKKGVKSAAVWIGKDVFIGMNCTVLKGVRIPDGSVIPAGSTVVASKDRGYKLR